MFEAYTQLVRKSIFMGRFEASQFGSQTIEIEHVFLGIIRADPALAITLFQSRGVLEIIHQRITQSLPHLTPNPTSVDLPLSQPMKRALSLATAEADRLRHKQIEPAHLFLGILRDATSLPAAVLREYGITVERLDEVAGHEKPTVASAAFTPVPEQTQRFRNLVQEANTGRGKPLVGRQSELGHILQILSRRTRNNPVLIGEPGVGKHALVQGLADRISEGTVPLHLNGVQILEVDVRELADFNPLNTSNKVILYCRGLFDNRHSMPQLAASLKMAQCQCIATASPLAFRLALDRGDELVRAFEPVAVLPPSDDQSLQIIHQLKDELELFHRVIILPEAVETAIAASARFLPDRVLPDRALDLIDDAATMVKLRAEGLPPELEEMRQRLRQLAKDRHKAMAANNFGVSKSLAIEEEAQRLEFFRLKKQAESEPKFKTVTDQHILEALSARTSLTVDQISTARSTPVPRSRRLRKAE